MSVLLTDCKKGDTIMFIKPGDRRRIGTVLAVLPKKGRLRVSYRILRDKLGTPALFDVVGEVNPDHVIGFIL
jgi:hypothetical protein